MSLEDEVRRQMEQQAAQDQCPVTEDIDAALGIGTKISKGIRHLGRSGIKAFGGREHVAGMAAGAATGGLAGAATGGQVGHLVGTAIHHGKKVLRAMRIKAAGTKRGKR